MKQSAAIQMLTLPELVVMCACSVPLEIRLDLENRCLHIHAGLCVYLFLITLFCFNISTQGLNAVCTKNKEIRSIYDIRPSMPSSVLSLYNPFNHVFFTRDAKREERLT